MESCLSSAKGSVLRGAYTIYDLPVVSKLQSWYLGEVGVYNVRLTNDIIPNSHDLFVALCSLSEVPAETRTAVLNAHPATHYLILVQHEWDGVNNVTWFKNWFDEEKFALFVVSRTSCRWAILFHMLETRVLIMAAGQQRRFGGSSMPQAAARLAQWRDSSRKANPASARAWI